MGREVDLPSGERPVDGYRASLDAASSGSEWQDSELSGTLFSQRM